MTTWSQVPTFVREKSTGLVKLNPAKQFIQPFDLTVDQPNKIVAIPAGQQRGPYPLSARFDGPFEAFFIKVLVKDPSLDPMTAYNIRVLLEHPGKRVQFMPRPIPLIGIAGNGSAPYILPETIFVPATQSLNVTFWNDDIDTRHVEFVLGGIKFYPHSADAPIREEIFSYTERRERTYTYWLPPDNPVNLVAGVAGQRALSSIPDDADIEVFKLTAVSTGRFSVQLRDATNDRALSPETIDASLVFGGTIPALATGGGIGGSGGIMPARWATSYLARRSTQIHYVFDEVSGAPNTVTTILGGRKVKYG